MYLVILHVAVWNEQNTATWEVFDSVEIMLEEIPDEKKFEFCRTVAVARHKNKLGHIKAWVHNVVKL